MFFLVMVIILLISLVLISVYPDHRIKILGVSLLIIIGMSLYGLITTYLNFGKLTKQEYVDITIDSLKSCYGKSTGKYLDLDNDRPFNDFINKIPLTDFENGKATSDVTNFVFDKYFEGNKTNI